MLIQLLASLSVMPAQAPTVTTAAPKQSSAGYHAEPFAEADPDVVVRGRSVKLVVRGRDIASLKTLQVSPSGGVSLRSITPLPARSDGSAAVSVDVLVDAAAEPRERALMLTVAPIISSSSSKRPGADSVSKAMDALLATVTRDPAMPAEAGTLYINSHDIAITGIVVAGKGESRQVRVTVRDAEGDLGSAAPTSSGAPISSAAPPAGGIFALSSSSDLIVSEAHCGQDIFDSILDDAMVRETKAGTVVLVAMLSTMTLEGAGTCSLRVRVRDAAGNTSLWFTTKLELR